MGGVTVIIRKLPNGTGIEDIRQFIKTGVSWRLRFFLKITRVTILTVMDKFSMETELHCLVTIEPDSFADRVVKRLHAKHLKGQRVVVKRYYERNPMNDRRRNLKGDAALQYIDKRINERRRQELLTYGGDKIKGFTRKLI